MVNPKDYVFSNYLQKDRTRFVINKFAKDLINISGRCMDVGCGPGNTTKDILLPALNPKAILIGTDISENMIKYANETYGDEERLKFETLDIQTKALHEKYISKFDHIFSFHVLHWCDNIHRAFENIYRMLCPGGTMLISFIASHNTLYEVLKIMAKDPRFVPYIEEKYISPFYKFHSIQPHKDLKDLLENVGFHIHYCNSLQMSFSASDNFLVSLMSLFPFLDKMSYNQKEEFKIEFIREYTNMKIKLYGNEQRDNKEETTILDFHTLLIAYAQKDKS